MDVKVGRRDIYTLVPAMSWSNLLDMINSIHILCFVG